VLARPADGTLRCDCSYCSTRGRCGDERPVNPAVWPFFEGPPRTWATTTLPQRPLIAELALRTQTNGAHVRFESNRPIRQVASRLHVAAPAWESGLPLTGDQLPRHKLGNGAVRVTEWAGARASSLLAHRRKATSWCEFDLDARKVRLHGEDRSAHPCGARRPFVALCGSRLQRRNARGALPPTKVLSAPRATSCLRPRGARVRGRGSSPGRSRRRRRERLP
jgi:hypothetical protein